MGLRSTKNSPLVDEMDFPFVLANLMEYAEAASSSLKNYLSMINLYRIITLSIDAAKQIFM
jgi:hypothetical protein